MVILRATENYFYPSNPFDTPMRIDLSVYEDTEKAETAIDRYYVTVTVTNGVADGNYVVTGDDEKTKKLVEQIVTASSLLSYFAKSDIVQVFEVTQVNKLSETWIDRDNDPNGERPYTVIDNFIVTLAKKANPQAEAELVENIAILITFGMRNGVDANGEPTIDYIVAVSNVEPDQNLTVAGDVDRVNWTKIIPFFKNMFKFLKRTLSR